METEALLKRLESLESEVTRLRGTGLGDSPARYRLSGIRGMCAGVGEVPNWAKSNTKLAERISQGLGDAGPAADSPFYDAVYELLSLGSPRLALARALGFRFNPFMINVRATFVSTDTTDIPDVGSDVKIVQDTLIDAAVVQITNQSNTANLSTFQPQSDYFYNCQSGIEATLDVQGAPRYTVAENFTPLSTLFDAPQRPGLWPRKWILTYQQQFFMSFHASVTLPFAPLDVTVSWRGWVPSGDAFTDLTNATAMDRLADLCGIVVSDAYRSRITGNV